LGDRTAARFLKGREERTVPLLRAALPGADPEGRKTLLYTLWMLDPSTLEDEKMMAEAIEILADISYRQRGYWFNRFIEKLTGAGSFADPLVPLVVDDIGTDDLSVLTAAPFLSGREKSAVPLLNEALTRADPKTRLSLLYVLWTLESDEDVLFPAVRKALGSDDPEVRIRAAYVASFVGPDLKELVPILARLFRDSDDDEGGVWEAAGEALWAMGESARSAIPVLKEAVGKYPDEWRGEVAGSLIHHIEGRD